jgi:FAD/FMN-containing dehydrogenase
MSTDLRERLAGKIRGDILTDDATRATYARDTSPFTRTPEVVVFPKDTQDVAALVQAVGEAKRDGLPASVAARSAGTDMSGGPLTDSVAAVFTKYMNKVHEVADGYAVAEPGVYYRDFEKATRARGNQLLPSYPASREIAALGGIVNNNSGGERTLEYGKTEKYVEEIEAVLSDGSVTTFKALNRDELAQKKALQSLEGTIYREMDELLTTHAAAIAAAKPKVSKNSAGYSLWNVKDEAKGTFDLAQLVTGAQGTLALTTKFKLRLVKEQGYRSMLVVFLSDIALLPEIVRKVLPFNPESFESYDDHTFTLAVKLLPKLLRQMGIGRALRLGLAFLPEVALMLKGGVPKLVLMAEFSEDTHADALRMAEEARAAISHLPVSARVIKDERGAEKYWVVRRESFALLRKNSKGLYATPFIDDFVVPPDSYPEFIPRLTALLEEYRDRFIYTVAGHVGDGNFHIIPLMDLGKPEVRQVILELAPRVYELVLEYGGTTTGEHNDGIIRTPYLPMQFGPEIVSLFEQTKRIFDPENIFNPGKKVGGTFADIERSLITKV